MSYNITDIVKSRHTKTKEVKRDYKVYLPIPKGRYNKASIRGFWYSQGKLFCDYITVKKYNTLNFKVLEYIKARYKQEAIFYKSKGKAYIYHSIRKVEILRKGQYIRVKRQDKGKLKAIIRHFQGATIHKSRSDYVAEVWR